MVNCRPYAGARAGSPHDLERGRPGDGIPFLGLQDQQRRRLQRADFVLRLRYDDASGGYCDRFVLDWGNGWTVLGRRRKIRGTNDPYSDIVPPNR